MAIDPTIITTVRADELPIAPITQDSIIMHAIGEILYQGTVAEIVALIPSVNYKPYEVKWLNVSDIYIDDNFDMADGATKGLGKVNGLWPGWAIMNGNNGTTNMDDAIPLGFGVTRNSMKEQVGENSKVLVKNNIPKMDLTAPVSDSDSGGGSKIYIMATDLQAAGTHVYTNAVNAASTNAAVNIQQKSYVQLFIMKLP